MVDKLFIISFHEEPSKIDVLELMDAINMWRSVRVIKEAAQPSLQADATQVCEACDRKACYCSSHWLKNGGVIVYYRCDMHAVVGSEKFD